MATKAKRKPPTSSKKFVYRDGARFAVKAQAAGEEIERIAKKHRVETDNGPLPVIAPRVFWEESRPEEAPCHAAFEWDDTEAAWLFRDEQARQLIRSVRVVENEEDGPSAAPTWVSVNIPGTDERGYVETARAWSEADMKKQAIAETTKLLKGIRHRLDSFNVFSGVAREIDLLPDPE